MHPHSSPLIPNLRNATQPSAGSRWPTALAIALAACALSALPARAQLLYWDSNADTAGAGITPAGTWGTDSFWSTDPLGLALPGAWVGGNDAIFSAGTDATGAYTVTLSAAQTAGSLSFEEGSVSLVGTTPVTNLTWNGQVSVASGGSASLNVMLSGSGGLTKNGPGTLALGNTNDFTGNVVVNEGALAWSVDTSAGGSQLGSGPATVVPNAIAINDATFRFTGGIITLHTNRGITLGGSGGTIDVTQPQGVGILLFDGTTQARIAGGVLTKTGIGEIRVYSATNTFAKLVINQGAVAIGQSTFPGLDECYGAVPTSVLADAVTIRNGATNRTIGSATVTTHANRGFTLGPGGGVFRHDLQPHVINGPITGPGGLTKFAARNFTLNGTLDYAGPTIIDCFSTTVTVAINGTNNATGPLAVNSGILTLNSPGSYSATTLRAARINVNTNLCLGTGPITISPTQNVIFANASVATPSFVTLPNDITVNNTGFVIDIAANSGRELILNGKVSGDANLLKNNTGSTGALGFGNSANDFTGILTNNSGTVIAAANNALGSPSGGTIISNNASLAFRGGINYSTPEPLLVGGVGRLGFGAISNDSGNNTFAGPVTVYANTVLGGLPGTSLRLDGVIGETGGSWALTKFTPCTIILGAANTYSGGTVISNGTLIVANTSGSATGPGPITIHAPGALSGPGSVAGTLTVNGVLSPGASPGTLNTANEIWNGGGSYVWEINDADAGQGTDPGWDLINVTGTLTINASPGNKFTIDITSLTPANAAGNVHDFDGSTDYLWTILKTTGGILGFDAAAFNVLHSNFSNPIGAGLFLVETANGGNDLVIRFVRAPAIAVQPVGQSAECGTGSATFSVSATGTAPLTYQWRRNGVDIGGANAATLTIDPTLSATAGNYDVVVANAYGSVTSAAAALTLVDTTVPVITTCAPDQTLSANANCQVAIPDLTAQVAASDTCGPVTKSQSPTAGTLVGLGPHTVTITVTDGASLTATCNATVTVNDSTPPTITVCAPDQSVTATLAGCMAALPDLTGQVTTTENCAGLVTVTQSPVAGSLVGVGPHVVTFTATDVAGNSTNCQATVTVTSGVTVTVNSTTICPGGSATLTATTGAASPSYLWSPGGAMTPSITVSPGVTTVYTVTVTDGATSCTGTGSGTVTVGSSLAVTVNSATICPGDSATLTATTPASNPTYLWSPGGETTASITVSPGSTTVYSVSVTDDSGCTGSASGTVTVRTADTFANSGAVTINDALAASPYPSVINVSGLTATVCKVTVTLNNLSHAFPDDIDMVLIAPNGQGVLLISDVGGANPVSGLTLTLDDAAAGSLPDSTVLTSGTFKPTNIGAKSDNRPDNFPAPVPVVNFVTNLSAFAGISPNGAWSLYVFDDEPVDVGSIAGGWSIAITTLTPFADVSVAQTPIPNPVGVGSNLTFNITVSNLGPAGADAVSLTDTLPAGMTFVSANTSQGSCGESLGVVTCALGSITAGGSVTIAIAVTPTAASVGNNVISVTSSTFDFVAANNSSSASVTVLDPPVIVTGPANQTVCADKSATFMVTATGAAPLSYQWYLNDVAIGGATAATYTIASAQVADAGTYKVVVSNPVGAAQASATLTVNPLPAVAVNSETICVGQSATLTATTGAASPAYLWSPGGATTASIIVNPASTTIYTVLVTDGVTGCTNSASGTVTVKALTTATALTSVANRCPGSPVSFSTTAGGDGPFTYVWRKNGSLLGETTSTLSIASVVSADAGTYTVEVTGFCNSVTNSATLTVVGPPTITTQPQNQTTPMGNGAVFSVAASSVVASNIQWQLNGVDIGGATSTSLAVSNVTLLQNGSAYRAIVSNCGGSTTSAVAVLTVTPVSGISFDFDTPGQFTNAPYYLAYNNWVNGAFLNPPGMFESSVGGVGPFPGSGALDLIPNNGSENSSVLPAVSFDFSLPGKTLFASTMFKLKHPGNNQRSTQFGFATATNSGINDVAGQGFATVIVQSTAQPAPTYELRHQRRTSGGGLLESTLTGTTSLVPSNWYKLSIMLTNTRTAGNSNYAVAATLQEMGPLGTTPGATVLSFVTATNHADIVNFRNVHLAIRGFENTGVDFRDNTYVWTTAGNVFFVQQPQNQTALQGRRAVFKALVDGEGPYTYQWFRNGSPIPNGRSWNYITPPTTTADDGSTYSVQVTGPANTINSSAATLTVTPLTLAVVSAGSLDGTTVGVLFNQPVNPASAENVANYTINGVNPAQARVYRSSLSALGPDGIYVILTPAGVLSAPYTVAVQNVQDLSGGVVGSGNTANGRVENLTGFDVNPAITGPPGENYSFGPGQFIVTGGGADIFGNADSFRYVYTTKSGDFDVIAKIPYMDTVRFVSKAAFDVRVSLDPFSPNALAGFNPGPMAEGSGTLRQFTEGNIRHTWNAASVGWGANTRLSPPDVWVRFRRAGNTLLRYSSSNGVNWTFDGQISPSPIFPDTLYFGLAVCSTRNLQAESAQFENYGNFAGYAGATIAITSQPTNFTVNAGGSFTDGLVATVTGGGIPASAGELAYVWQRNDGSGTFTNLLTSGATNNTVSIGPLFGSDNGAQFRCVVKAPGAADVISATFTATVNDTTLPTLASVNAAVVPSYPVSEVLLNFSENLSAATATDIANYTVTNASGVRLTVLSATFLHGDSRTVLVKVDGQLGLGNASVGISGLRDLNNNLLVTTNRPFRAFLPSTAPVVVEVYQDIGGGTAVTDLTNHALYTGGTPTFICYSNLFGFNVQNNFTGIQDNYGVKAYTYFVPPTNGNYKFWIRSDDAMELRLNSSGTSPGGAVLIAANAGANNNYTVGSTPANSVTNIALLAGQSYYMEALLKEGGGGDGFSVMWTDPAVNTAPGTGTLIPTANLAYPASAAPSTPVVMDIYTGYQNFLAGFNQLAGLTQATNFPIDNYAISTVNYKYIAGVPDVIGYQKYFGAQPATLGNTRLDNYLGRLQSYFIPPSTGLYRFWMGVDDVGQLYMNTNAVNSTDPAGVVFLGQSANAFVSTASQLVAQNVPLVGGQKYYMMVLWREGGGGDGIRMAVRPQSDSSTPPVSEVIPASMLEYPLEVGRAGMVSLRSIVPANPTVIDGRSLTLCAGGISGAAMSAAGGVGTSYGFFWLKNGVRVLENAFTNVTPPLTMADNGAVYTLVVTNFFSRAERSVTVTVLPDGTAPTIVRTTGRRYNDGFTIQFSEPMDAASATYLGNYQVSGGLLLRSATLDPSRTMVSFETSPQSVGTTYTITLNGVRDASSTGNLIAPNTMTSFSTWVVGGSGFLVELWTNIVGSTILDLTGTPKFAANLPDVVNYTNVFGIGAYGANTGLENYGARITGYFIPTNSGFYRFYLRSDDASELFMNINSTDSENPAGRTMLIHQPNANQSIFTNASVSPPVALNQGQRYYLEALMKEGTGGDFLLLTFRATDAAGTSLTGNPVDTVSELQFAAGNFDGAPGNPDLIQVTQTPPSDVFVSENEQVTLRLAASVPVNVRPAVSYQWQRFDGVAYTNIPGATASNLIFFVNLSDDLARYRLVFSAPGHGTSTYVTTVHVANDTQPPYIVSVNSLDGTTIGVCFNERIQNAGAIDNFSYYVNEGANIVTIAAQRSDLRSVILTVDPPVVGEFTVRAENQVDLATVPNTGTSTTNGVVQGFVVTDVGAPLAAGSSYSCVPTEVDIIAGGSDIWNNSDVGHLTLSPRSGDFDIHTRVHSLSPADPAQPSVSKAGIMVRQTMDANSPLIYHSMNPPPTRGRDLGEVGQRLTVGGATALFAGSASYTPAGIPNAWVRAQRRGNTFSFFRSSDGVNWIQVASGPAAFPNRVFIGLATTAHTATQVPGLTTLAEYRNVYIPNPPMFLVQPSPASQTIALGGSVSYSVVVSNPPNSGALKLQWRRNGVVIPNATNATLTLNNLAGSDAGIYTVSAGNDGGEGDASTPVVLNVANGLPVTTAKTLVATQGLSLTVAGSSLLLNDTDPEAATLSLLGVNGVCSSLIRTGFETGLPANSAIYSGPNGTTLIDVNGGTANSRVLKLTQPLINQAGSIVFGDLGVGAPLAGFRATFNLRISDASGEPADGFSFNFAGDLPDDVSFNAENGVGTGFSFCVDNYRFAPFPAGGTANTSGMKIRYNNSDVAGVQSPTWNAGAYIPVSITLAPDGALTVLVNGTNVFGNVVLPFVPAAGRFGIYARTGNQFESHWVDDLSVTPIYRTPNGGLVAMDSGTGDVTYTPPASFCGLDSFVYLASDGQEGGTSCGMVTVKVTESTLANPMITSCATNRTLTLPNANPMALPDLTGELVTTDNCCCVTVTQSPAAGTLVGAGVTVVTFTATDLVGLTAQCQATLTILPASGPPITGSSYNGGMFSASFATHNGLHYTVAYKDHIDDPTWTTLTVITGDGTVKSFTDPGPLPPTRFYQVTVGP